MMRKSLAFLLLPIVLSSCSLSQDSRFVSITDGKSFVEYMIPHNRAVVRSSAQILNISRDETMNAVFRNILLTRNKETRDMQQAYRSWTNVNYPILNVSAEPAANIDGLVEADATQAYIEAIIKHHEEAIAASKYAKKTGTGTTLNVLADMVITNQEKEIEQLRELLNGK